MRTVLDEIGAGGVPELLVFNKSDLAPDEAKQLMVDHHGSVAVSAVTGEGLDVFLRTLGDRLRALTKIAELSIPYDRGDVLASVHREGEVVATTEGPDGFVGAGPVVGCLARPAGRVRGDARRARRSA